MCDITPALCVTPSCLHRPTRLQRDAPGSVGGWGAPSGPRKVPLALRTMAIFGTRAKEKAGCLAAHGAVWLFSFPPQQKRAGPTPFPVKRLKTSACSAMNQPCSAVAGAAPTPRCASGAGRTGAAFSNNQSGCGCVLPWLSVTRHGMPPPSDCSSVAATKVSLKAQGGGTEIWRFGNILI